MIEELEKAVPLPAARIEKMRIAGDADTVEST